MNLTNTASMLQSVNLCMAQERRVNKQQQKLSTGVKIVGAGDGASEYAISEKMRAMIRGLEQDVSNLKQGTHVTQTAGGGLDRIMEILTTLKEKAINSANDTNTDADRAIMQKEVDQMLNQIDEVANTTEINGVFPLREGGQFGAAKGYSSGMGRIDVSNTGGYRVYDAADPSRYLLQLDHQNGFTPKIRVSDGTQNIQLNLNGGTFIKDVNMFIHADKSVTYEYSNGDISFKIHQSYELVREQSEFTGHEAYNLIYTFENTGTKDLKYDIALPVDPIDGKMNTPKINGKEEANSTLTRYNSSQIEQGTCETVLCNPDVWPVICNATATVSGEGIYNQPDYIVVGNQGDIQNWSYLDGSQPIPNTAITNYHYAPSWLDKSVSAGASYTVNTIMGVTFPIVEQSAKDLSTSMWIQSGTKSNDGIFVPFCDATTKNLGIETLDLMTQQKASKLLSSDKKTGPIDLAIKRVAGFNSRFGAYQKRMEFGLANVTTQSENTQGAESTIRDANMAKEMVGFTKNNILMQSAQAMLAQSNSNAQSVLGLLQM